MGFGHRVYKNYDPRAKLMRETCHEVLNELGLHNDRLFKLAIALEKIALEDDYFVERKLYPNVDFYSGIVQRALGIPVSMFTCIFSLARTVGWIAQWQEMITDPEYKIGRPRQLYKGATQRDVKPIDTEVTPLMLKEFLANSYLFGANAPFIEELYEKYLANPAAVPDEWREYFDRMQVLPGSADGKDVAHAPVVESFVQRAKRGEFAAQRTLAAEPVAPERLQVAALLLVTAYRISGSRWATVDPLKRMPRPAQPELEPAYYDLDRGRPRPGGERRLVRRA